MYGYIDWTYLVFVLPFFALSLWASASVKSAYRKYSSQLSSRGLTGKQAAEIVLRSSGVTNVSFQEIGGELTDHYDPQSNAIRLSKDVYHGTSTAAIGVACHEAGHAVQYAESYGPIRIRAAIIPVTNIGSKAAIPLILAGFFLEQLGRYASVGLIKALFFTGILCYCLSVLFQLITLPVEFDASSRALKALESQKILTSDELGGARATLRAAALTYVAAAAASVAQLIRLLILISGNRRRND